VRIVFDTTVLAAAFRSRRGASVRLLSRLGTGAFEVAVSVPLVFEYEDVLMRDLAEIGITSEDVSAVVDYICKVATRHKIFFLWRPVLRDPGDDLVLETAVAATCDVIVSHNVRDYDRARDFGVRALSPGMFLNEIDGVK
jgi:predicted nucleic acid-binding protein